MKKLFQLRWLGLALLLMGSGCAVAQNDSAPDWDVQADTWVATDALGRTTPTADEVGAPKDDKFVGIFYFTWQGPHGYDAGAPMQPDQGVVPKPPGDYKSPYDITKLLAENPDNPQWGPHGAFHYWTEPLWGYYVADDPWVIRKNAQLLSDAGVDVIVMDVTNGLTYTGVYMAICRVYTELRAVGEKTPQIAFLANSNHPAVVQKLYEEFYSQNLYPDLWFMWKGKPLIMANPQDVPEPMASFFTFRQSWAWSDPNGWFGDGKDKWPWLESTPQKYGWHESPEAPEQIAVAVAQHPTSNLGRSHSQGVQPPPAQQKPEQGIYFQEQWDRALEVDPEFIFVTGWNEWVAQRFVTERDGQLSMCGRPLKAGESFFVDTWSQEYSRDIEPMLGGHTDNYYWQLVDNIRRFKGARPAPVASQPRSMTMDGNFEKWAEVMPEYRDHKGDAFHRDHIGFGRYDYVNATGRNDFEVLKVTQDEENLYFYAKCAADISHFSDPNWMLLFLDTDLDPATGWQGFNFVINRTVLSGSRATIEATRTGWDWQKVGEVTFQVKGSELELAIPRAALRLAPGRPLNFRFKWSDNMQENTAEDWLINGDTAPTGRFAYVYREQ